jgi:hypothetical protein
LQNLFIAAKLPLAILHKAVSFNIKMTMKKNIFAEKEIGICFPRFQIHRET